MWQTNGGHLGSSLVIHTEHTQYLTGKVILLVFPFRSQTLSLRFFMDIDLPSRHSQPNCNR
uniref:Uncharacterized protein n=1 Tax=Arundo donax TaxID=35708 RepID=A0A0A9NSL7_ARUDO